MKSHHYWLCRALMVLGLCECVIILLCQLVDKESLFYSGLQRMNIVMYFPDLENRSGGQFSGPPIAGTGSRGGIGKSKGYDWLLKGPIFSHFNITEPEVKKKVNVVIIISSGPMRFDRRQAIRDTWLEECKPIKEVNPECIFMTDYQNPGDEFYQMLQEEWLKYGDVHFQTLEGGVQFGQRMLYHMVYALANYEFDYFLRMDDDHFFCLQNFLHEVPLPMIKQFHWGWVHCIPTITRAEENMIMFSRDVVHSFVTQDPNKMLCHPWADQMIASWSKTLDMTYLFRHDNRIHHTPIVSLVPKLRQIPDVCKYFISIHGTYPDDMRLFYTHRGPKEPSEKPPKDLFMNSQVCPIKVPFDWRAFSPEWRFEPKFCVNKPTWNTSSQLVIKGTYAGREEQFKAP